VLRLHIDAGVAYRARPLRAGVDVLRTEGCPAAALEGWTTIAAGGVVQRQIPGDTFSMLQQPHVESVGRSLGSALQDADR
jgi:thioesterase domain-containing protein